MLTFAVETTTHTTCTCRGSPASSYWLAKEPLKTAINLLRSGCDIAGCLHLPLSHSELCSRGCAQLPPYLALNASITGCAIVAVFKDFLHSVPSLTERGLTLTYALRCSSIDLMWPMARVGLSPLGHTLTQFIMLWQRNTLKASLSPSRRLSVSVSRLSIRKR